MRQKYIDEKWPLLMQFGRHAQTGQPYVSDCNDDVNVLMADVKDANTIIEHYNKLHAEFSAMAHAFDAANPDAFTEFWYNRKE